MYKMKPKTAAWTSLAAGVGLLVGGASSEAMYDYWLHTPTPREALLSQLAHDVFELDTKVVCLDPEEVKNRGLTSNSAREAHATYGWPSLVWMRNNDCAAVETFTYRPPEMMLALTDEELKALGIFSHELRHTAGVKEEDQADCEGMQLVHKIPLALGASAMTARKVGDMVAGQLAERREDRTDAYAISRECRAGGDYDLRLVNASFPPKPSPKS